MKAAISSVVIAVCGLTVLSQSPSPPRTGRADTVQREQQRQVEMQMIEQVLATEGRTPHAKRYPAAVLDQIRADFLQIQVTERKLTKTTAAGVDLDLKLVGQLTGDILKRSRRLKENLSLPQPPAPEAATITSTAEDNHERLRSSLGVLSGLIESFVSNPMFEHSRLLDQDLSDKASRDLAAIIRLSGEIKRSSERLRK
jgi:hypothetical protein